MTTETKGLEFFVGLFVFIGLAIIAIMVLVLGRFSGGMQSLYTINVEFPNASGLVKGCDVLISGAKVGTVADSPRLTGERYAVAVDLRIGEQVKIPRTANFQIRTNGMLGDAYVDVVPPAEYTEADYALPNEKIVGTKVSGFDELTSKGGDLVDRVNREILTKLSSSLDEIKIASASLNEKFLTERNMKNVEDTFANLKSVTGEFSKTATELDQVMRKAQEAIDSVKVTLKIVDGSAGELKLALGDLRKMADTGTKTIDSAKVLINKATTGEGTLGTLISDKQMALDLRTLIANMRRSGVFFYKDRPLPQATPIPAPAPVRRRP
jgi:phospholipid/cholesterol/gamma-HCH transport system substrate-binding protein